MQDATAQGSTRRPIPTADTSGLMLAVAPNPSQQQGISAPWHPAAPTAGGGALPPRGGSGGPSPALVAAASGIHSTARASSSPKNAPNSTAGSPRRLPRRPCSRRSASAPAERQHPRQPRHGRRIPRHRPTTVSRNALAVNLNGGGGGTPAPLPGLSPLTSPAFELKTLDYNDGSVMVPGFDQLATPGGSVDLRAQVRDSATGTYTYSWDTSGLSRRQQHQRHGHRTTSLSTGTPPSPRATAESVTLTVTDPNLDQVSQTYTFWVPAGTGTSTGGTTWNNTTLDPGLLQATAPAFGSQNVSVVEDTGALETSITLPTL